MSPQQTSIKRGDYVGTSNPQVTQSVSRCLKLRTEMRSVTEFLSSSD